MWSQKRRGYFFNGGRDIECDMYSQGPLAIFFFLSLFFLLFFFFPFFRGVGMVADWNLGEGFPNLPIASPLRVAVQEKLIDSAVLPT